MTAAIVWLILGLVMILAELVSGEFVLLMLGGGALVAAGASALVDNVWVGVLVFAVSSVLLLFAVRPALRRRLDRSVDHSPMHHNALVGESAVVTTRIDGHGGRVRIGGDLWSAKAHDGAQVIEEGERVTVVDIAGATALVVAQRDGTP